MNIFIGFLVSAVLTMALSVTIVVYSRKALYELLVELCGNGARARYWTLFTGLLLTLSALYGVLVSSTDTDSRLGVDFPGIATGVSSFRAGVLGLLLALGAIGIVMVLGIHRHENQLEQANRQSRPKGLVGD